MNSEQPRSLFWYRVKFLTLIAVFLSPFIVGWLALYVFDIRPESGNYGSLVQPVKKIAWPPVASVDGRRFEDGFGRRWTFVMFSGANCDERCFSNLFYMRQIRTLLGKDTMRLQNVLITSAPLGEKLSTYLREFPNMVVIENFRERKLYSQFQLDGLGEVGAEPRMYLIDPDQNFMMHYSPESDQNRVLEDIKKLMKLSQIG